ncbi:predicted protein [Uncinocarpus reesii 1704]|uniref:TACO1/YebC-like second and third domain-containing protein n=1 Tax=Uncinocarpus reesii (strain UAMH 1704) TaxID=336963 RepID=C4JR42_UNCRE|nr:uncharacterized protein UREG_03524 [Uncinocarpus reesii 1704]EEP78678.1 predicted protein [Uncinocarpus reesii 1704]
MSKATIDAAIARGQGISSSGAPLEQLTIEAMLPGSVAVVIVCLTDQKARTMQDVRTILKKSGGTISPVTFLFEKKGKVVFEKDPQGKSADDYLEDAIDAGAADISADSEGRLILYTEPTMTKSVGEAMSATAGLKIESSDIIWDPNKDTMATLQTEEAMNEVDVFLERIHDEPTVQEIYMNLART